MHFTKTKTNLPFINFSEELFNNGNRADVFKGMDVLCNELFELKQSLSEQNWKVLTQKVKTLPINKLLIEAPQIKHSQRWPRGYMGDAVMMDLIYNFGASGLKYAKASKLGRFISQHQKAWPTHEAARNRLIKIATVIDEVIASNPSSTILSIACGHLRESVFSHALKNQKVSKFIALDQDPLSTKVIEEAPELQSISVLNQSITTIIRKKIKGQFDLIYAAGLYDYLNEQIGTKLIEAMFEMLNPGGRILIANFTKQTTEMGFLEAFMNWPLIYREMEDLWKLTLGLPQNKVSINIHPDIYDTRNRLLYLDIVRK